MMMLVMMLVLMLMWIIMSCGSSMASLVLFIRGVVRSGQVFKSRLAWLRRQSLLVGGGMRWGWGVMYLWTCSDNKGRTCVHYYIMYLVLVVGQEPQASLGLSGSRAMVPALPAHAFPHLPTPAYTCPQG